ncbi:MAG: NAD-dependent epimerase/dehydratase family protein [Acetobacteraceae bacterium]|nr:NAD-dependent epimerase/dehydratase family protein [Acetobacteraceae bacterium]
MRIFVSGIAGFLGSYLAERLLAIGHDVVGCDSLLGRGADQRPGGCRVLPVRLP